MFEGARQAEQKKGRRLFRGKAKKNESLHKEKDFIQERKHLERLGIAQATKLSTEDLCPDDVIIAVMGPTGAGKSTFINLVTNFDVAVGHDLKSCTSEINIVKLSFLGLSDYDIVFIDTPGFDDTHMSDTTVLAMISDWLKKTYDKDILLSGLLYLHRISDNRMAGTPLRNLQLFEKLCGENMLKNVILVTTMWDELWDEAGLTSGNAREQELQSIYWKGMIAQGSSIRRLTERSRTAAFRVLEPILEVANTKHSMRIQRELTDLGLQLRQTSAGKTLFSSLETALKKQQEALAQIRVQIKVGVDDMTTLKVLMEQCEELRGHILVQYEEVQKLKLSFGERLHSVMVATFNSKVRRF